MAKYNFSGYDIDQMNVLYNSYSTEMKIMEILGETDTEEYQTIQKGVGAYGDLVNGNISDNEFRNRMKAI